MKRSICLLLFVYGFVASSLASAQNALKGNAPSCFNRQELSVRTAGFVEEVLKSEGANVKGGDLIVRLDRRVLMASKKEVAAGLRAAKASLKLAEDAHRRLAALKATEGVTEQELLEAEMRSEQARAVVEQAAAALERVRAQIDDTEIVAALTGRVFGLPKTKGLYVQPGQSIGRIEVGNNCSDSTVQN